jgi:hypothetical protein
VRLTNLYPRHRRSSLLATAPTFALAATAAVSSAPSTSAPMRIRSVAVSASALHDVVLIGNSVSGTVSFLDGRSFANLGSINVPADAAQVLTGMIPIDRLGYEMVKSVEKGIRYVDDLHVSRGELQDVVAFDIATRRQIWRTKVEGFKTDHAALSPDGTQLIVSATTAHKAYVLSTQTGAVITSFGTGTYPHAGLKPATDYALDLAVGGQRTLTRFLIEGLLARLDRVDPFHRQLAETGHAFISHRGRLDVTAAILHVHPNTVSHRLRRLADLTGFSVAEEDGRSFTRSAHWWWAVDDWLGETR